MIGHFHDNTNMPIKSFEEVHERKTNISISVQQQEMSRSTIDITADIELEPYHEEEIIRKSHNFIRVANFYDPKLEGCDGCVDKLCNTCCKRCTCLGVCLCTFGLTYASLVIAPKIPFAACITTLFSSPTLTSCFYVFSKKHYRRKKINRAFPPSYENYLNICSVKDLVLQALPANLTISEDKSVKPAYIVLEYFSELSFNNSIIWMKDYLNFFTHAVLNEKECREAYTNELSNHHSYFWWMH